MACPECGAGGSYAAGVRMDVYRDSPAVRRRRRCAVCGACWETVEVVEEVIEVLERRARAGEVAAVSARFRAYVQLVTS